MSSPFLGEFMGTLMLILLGDGVVAGVLLNKTKAQNSGWIVITTGWAFAVTIGIYVAIAFGSKEAFINPAVAVWAAIATGDASKLAVDIPAEFLGAFVGGVLVWLQYLPHWKETEDKGFKLAVFCTAPAIRSRGANLMSETIGTIVLIVGVGTIVVPLTVNSAPLAGGLSLGGTTGYAINPARDLGPRIAHAVLPIAGKGGSDWGYSWIPVVGPMIGAVVGAYVLKMI
jgi:glycerol uptake facilitator protein